MPDTIFLSLPSYRDPELVPTVNDAIKQAADASRLRFCIGWQHTPEETLPKKWYKDDRFIILDVPTSETKGVCWMRSLIQQKWSGEDFFLGLDSHHRFVEGCDNKCIHMWSSLAGIGVKKPLLTAYMSSYDPKTYPKGRTEFPYMLRWDRFIPEGSFFVAPSEMTNWKKLRYPLPT